MTRRAHPDFDDHGTLDWNRRWSAARAEASRSDRLIFVELGRET